MKASIKSQLRELAENSQLISFQVNVTAESATKAKVEVGLDLADPLRTVENVITIGE
jgi:NACalpha-BTF3-like transcription factor